MCVAPKVKPPLRFEMGKVPVSYLLIIKNNQDDKFRNNP